MKRFYVQYIILCTILFSCTKGPEPGPDPAPPSPITPVPPGVPPTTPPVPPVETKNIYMAGIINGASVYWKNGEVHILARANTIFTKAYGISVAGTDVYVAGYVDGGSAVVWKNGVRKDLSNEKSDATCVLAVNNDIYVGGSDNTGNGNRAVYWKNGEVVQLAVSNELTSVTGMVMSGGDLYAVGYIGRGAAYWKNNIQTTISNAVFSSPTSTWAHATSIAVDGSDVYVAGTLGTAAVYWKNGVPVVLANGAALAHGIAVSGTDVHVVGFFESKPAYWKNGELTILESGAAFGEAFGICLSGQDVYIAGHLGGNAVYWKNGKKNIISTGINSDVAYSITVREP